MNKDILTKIFIVLSLASILISLTILGVNKNGIKILPFLLTILVFALEYFGDGLVEKNIKIKIFYLFLSGILFSSVFLNYNENHFYYIIPILPIFIGIFYKIKMKNDKRNMKSE